MAAISPGSSDSDHPGNGCEMEMHPGGVPASGLASMRSIQIPIVVVDSGLLEKGDQFFAKGFLPMMLLLIGDVSANRITRGGADGECRISLLPPEVWLFERLPRPGSGSLLQFTHEIGKAMRGFQADQQVDMIRHASDSKRNSSKTMLLRRDTHENDLSIRMKSLAHDSWSRTPDGRGGKCGSRA